MSQAKPPLPLPGDARTLAVVNNIFTTIGTVSGTLDGENIAEEGLDEFSLANQATVPIYFTADGRTVNTNGTTYATLQVNGADVQSGGFTIALDQQGTVRAEFQCTNDPAGATVGIPVASVVSARLRKSVSAVVSVLVGTTMDEGDTQTGVYTMDSVLPPGVYDWLEIQAKCVPAANYYADHASIIVEVQKRATP